MKTAVSDRKCDPGILSDPAAFRGVFAAPDEALVFGVLSGGSSRLAETLFKTALELSRLGTRMHWVLVTDCPLQRELEHLPSEIGNLVYLLDSWVLTLLPESLLMADAIILDSSEAVSNPSIPEGLPPELPILRPLSAQEGGAPDTPGVHRYKSESVESLGEILLGCLAKNRDLRRTLDVSDPSTQAAELPARTLTPAQAPAAAPSSPAFILYNDWGIGDELLLSAVAREVVRAHPAVRVWIRSRFGFRFPSYVGKGLPPPGAKRVETIYQNAALYGPASHSPFPGHLVEQMLGKFSLDTGFLVEAQDVRPELDLGNGGIPVQRPRSVVLHSRPNPRLPSKDWGLSRWAALAEILHSERVTLLQVGAEGEDLLPHAEDLRGIPPGRIPDIVRLSGMVVSLVGLLMHMAAATRTPAIVIYGGREHPAIDGYPDQVHLSSGALPCRGRWGCHLAPDLACPHGMRCMEELTPELVARKVLRSFESPLDVEAA